MSLVSVPLLQRVGERVVARWLVEQGKADVVQTAGRAGLGGRGVDITYEWQGARQRVKVKTDPYFGIDPAKVGDRSLTYYREDKAHFAFEAVANAATREPGWVFDSEADYLYYYFVAISQAEDEIQALADEPDEVFFGELMVDRDELVILPMKELRAWFEVSFERYTPRPVLVGGASAWYRLVPRADLHKSVEGMRSVGSVFRTLVR